MLWLLLLPTVQAMCEMPDPWALPPDGTVDVPTDVQPLWITIDFYREDRSLEVWYDDQLAAFELSWEETAGDPLWGRITLVDSPAPGTVVTLTDGTESASFTIGSGPEDAAPSVPEPMLLGASAHRDTVDCDGSTHSVSTWPSAAARVATPTWLANGGYLQARVLGPDGSETLVAGQQEQLSVEAGGCTDDSVPAMLDWDSFELQLRGVTWAGQLTEWSEPLSVTLPWPVEPECTGCSTVSPVQAWPGLFALLLALPRRRRRD